MTRFERTISDAVHHLRSAGYPFALVGGLAVSARTEPRFTRDVDLAVAVAGDDEAEAVVRVLLQSGYEMALQIEQEATGRLSTVRLRRDHADDQAMLDLLFASSGIEPEVVAAATELEVFPSLLIPVATRSHLIALKILARDDTARPQDQIDLHGLLGEATAADLAAARDALDLITGRGFDRGRDLLAALDQAIDRIA